MKEEFKRWKRRIESGFADNKSAFYKEVVQYECSVIKTNC